MGSIDEDVVAFDVSVDDWGRLGVQVIEAFEQLFAPTPNNLDIRLLQLCHIPKILSTHELRGDYYSLSVPEVIISVINTSSPLVYQESRNVMMLGCLTRFRISISCVNSANSDLVDYNNKLK